MQPLTKRHLLRLLKNASNQAGFGPSDELFMVLDHTAILTMLSPVLGQRFVVLFPNTENGPTRVFLGDYVAEVHEEDDSYAYSVRHGSNPAPVRKGAEVSLLPALGPPFGSL